MRIAMGLAVASGGMDATALCERPEELHRQLAWWRAKGIEGVVLYDNVPAFYQTPPEQFAALAQTIRAEGLEIAAFNGLRKSLFMPERTEADLRACDHILAVCRVVQPTIVDLSVNVPIPVGLDPMQMAARPIFRGEYAGQEAYRTAAALLKPFVRACGQIGAQFSIELHDDGLQDTAEGCLKLLQLIGEPNVGVNPDLGNWYRVPYQHLQGWRSELLQLAPHTNYWEVKNYRRVLIPEAHRAYSWPTDLDAGDLDFREAATILWRAGFRGWICNEGGNGDRVRSTTRYLEYMQWIRDEWLPLVEDSAVGKGTN